MVYIFKTTVEGDFSTLGTFIGYNTCLEALEIVLPGTKQGDRTAQLCGLLSLNKEQNKDHVATKKILRYHTQIDMEPPFEWSSEDERSIKSPPFVIAWFERAKEAVAIARPQSC